MQVQDDYTGTGRKELSGTLDGKGPSTPDGDGVPEVTGHITLVGEESLKLLPSMEPSEKLGFNGKPLQVKEALLLILERVKKDPTALEHLKKSIESAPEETEQGEKYRSLLAEMLNESNEETRKRVEEMNRIEKDWVLIENDGVEPDVPPYVYTPPTWGTTAWNATKTGGSVMWNVGKISGKVCYRVYVESARIGTLALLGFMVVENPLFPVLQMVVKHVILK